MRGHYALVQIELRCAGYCRMLHWEKIKIIMAPDAKSSSATALVRFWPTCRAQHSASQRVNSNQVWKKKKENMICNRSSDCQGWLASFCRAVRAKSQVASQFFLSHFLVGSLHPAWDLSTESRSIRCVLSLRVCIIGTTRWHWSLRNDVGFDALIDTRFVLNYAPK